MAILRHHVPYYREIFGIPGFFSEPILVFGYQEIGINPVHFDPPASLLLNEQTNAQAGLAHPDIEVPETFRATDLVAFIANRGIGDVRVVDLFDPRANLRYDMNLPVPREEHDRYATFIDIGSLEHVFDTRQCLENCLRMVKPGGLYFLHTCVNGYFRHGLHTFNPEGLLQALDSNGFEIVYHKYSTQEGRPLDDPAEGGDVLIWLVGRKQRTLGDFVYPQQGKWRTEYQPRPTVGADSPTTSPSFRARDIVRWLLPPILTAAYHRLRRRA